MSWRPKGWKTKPIQPNNQYWYEEGAYAMLEALRAQNCGVCENSRTGETGVLVRIPDEKQP